MMCPQGDQNAKSIAIIASCGANVTSVQYALQRLGRNSVITNDVKLIQSATHVILPGVGTAKHAMQKLQENNLIKTIINLQQPVLGICLGMQILFQHSAEGDVECLGIFPGTIKPMLKHTDLPVPHMGWNQLTIKKTYSSLLDKVEDKSFVYYAHSFSAAVSETTQAITHYGMEFSAVVQRNNFFGVQFHPERSGEVGMKILENFMKI